MLLDSLSPLDLRGTLPSRGSVIGRYAAKTGITLHYNGPPVADRSRHGELAQLRVDARYHMERVWGTDRNGRPLYGKGIMYHFAVLSSGEVVALSDLDEILYHCANATGNRESIAVHLPLGGAQDASEAQWDGFGRLCEALIGDFAMAGRQVVRGHREWPRLDGIAQSACPGPLLMRRLVVWRGMLPAPVAYRVIASSGANIRRGAGVAYPVAGTVRAGEALLIDAVMDVGGTEARWGRLADGRGFIATRLLEVAS